MIFTGKGLTLQRILAIFVARIQMYCKHLTYFRNGKSDHEVDTVCQSAMLENTLVTIVAPVAIITIVILTFGTFSRFLVWFFFLI